MASNLKTVRVIANNTALKQLKTVNVLSAPAPHAKSHLQSAGANPAAATYMDSGGTVKGLPTIAIAGYVGPA